MLPTKAQPGMSCPGEEGCQASILFALSPSGDCPQLSVNASSRTKTNGKAGKEASLQLHPGCQRLGVQDHVTLSPLQKPLTATPPPAPQTLPEEGT